jgi:hypothetical protein
MKTKLSILFFAVLFILTGLALSSEMVFATVGGPTYIYRFKYNPKDESVYYIQNDHGGRGCPPELMKMSLATGNIQTVFSCDQGEKLFENDYSTSPVDAEINKIISGFKDLTPINLKDNKISVDVTFVKNEKISPEIDEISGATFTASVYQGNKKITDLTVHGCNTEQPFTFAGYAIPGFEKKIVLLLSTIGNCFEGGYIDENLYVVGGVENINRNSTATMYKDNSALSPTSMTLVVFEPDKVQIVNDPMSTSTAPESPTESTRRLSIITTIIIAVVAILLGIVFGRLTNKRK